jgi:hypothetical protein
MFDSSIAWEKFRIAGTTAFSSREATCKCRVGWTYSLDIGGRGVNAIPFTFVRSARDFKASRCSCENVDYVILTLF